MTFERDPAGFIDTYIRRDEKGRPFALSDYQRAVLALAIRFDPSGRLLLRVFVWGEMKKSGKTFLAAALGLWWAFTRADTEVIVAANDLEQSTSRVFATMTKLVEHNPAMKDSVKAKATTLELTNGTVVKAIPSDYRGEAGSRHSLAIFDELWGYDSERAQRLFEELTPPPTEPSAWILVATTAGFVGESVLLERLHRRGLAGERLDADLEVYRADDLVMFWAQTARQPWQTETYYAEQARLLRPSTFRRLHRNEWVAAESTFIDAAIWDACVDERHHPSLGAGESVEFVGVDAGIKHDNAAIVRVRKVGDGIELVGHRIWKPTPGDPLDLEETIEAYLLDLRSRVRRVTVVCDPYQLHRSIVTLKKRGLDIAEYPQTPANLTAAGQALFDALRGRAIRIYPASDLRQQALNTIAVESARGWRIAKEKASRKIDAIVALAMAVRAAIATTKEPPRAAILWGHPDGVVERAERARAARGGTEAARTDGRLPVKRPWAPTTRLFGVTLTVDDVLRAEAHALRLRPVAAEDDAPAERPGVDEEMTTRGRTERRRPPSTWRNT